MGRRVIVIGCGYVGSALGARLAAAGHEVVGTTTSPARAGELDALGIRPVVARIGKGAGLHELLRDRQTVFLTIASGGRGPQAYKLYPAAVKCVADALEGSAVEHIVYTSSTRVYAQNDGSRVDESSPTEPTDEQGRLLLAAERELLARVDRHGGDPSPTATIVRLSGIYGPGRDPADRIVALAGTRRDDGDVFVNVIHLEDIVTALAALLDRPHHGVLNLSDDQPLLRRAYYDAVLQHAGLPPIGWTSGGSGSGRSARGKRVANDRIKRLLNLTLRYPTRAAGFVPRATSGAAR